ncbi:MAG: hypothetical protein GEU82_13275 [Luteitalea sp.]|nr:hypothetical protein [Luteitalea sp.]
MDRSDELADVVNGLIEEGEAFRRVRAVSASPARSRPARGARVFHAGMAVAFLLTTFAGFAPTYFLRGLSDRPPLSPLLHVHGLVFTSWLLLLLTQTVLVARYRVDWHRRLGIAGAVLAAVMVPLGIMAGIAGARHGIITGGSEPLVFLIFPLGQMVLFAAFVGAAVWKRRQPESHRRLILLSTAVVVTPAISRIPFVPNPIAALGLSTLFVAAGIVHDWRSRGRVHPVYIWGGLIILVSGPVRFALGQTGAWQAFARLLVE